MKRKILQKTILGGVISGIFSLLFLVSGVMAEPKEGDIIGGFTVSPPNQQVVLLPGESYTYTISVSNPSMAEKSIEVLADVSPFGVQTGSQNYDFDFSTKSNYNQLVDWITIENPEGTIEPNETFTIVYHIDVPEDAPAGGQYASIGVQRVPEEKQGGNVAISETMEIASLIYATIVGSTEEKAEILANDISMFSFDSKIQATSLVKNEGNVHEGVWYTLQVFPLFSDEEIYTNEESPDSIVVIPDQTYFRTEEWTGPAVGIFKVRQTVKIAGEVSVVEKFVILCPLWLMFVIVLAIILLVFWIFSKNRKRNN